MKEKIFINARIIDPSQNMDEKGSLILNDKGKVRAIGKNVKKTDFSKDAEIIDLKGNILIFLELNHKIRNILFLRVRMNLAFFHFAVSTSLQCHNHQDLFSYL